MRSSIVLLALLLPTVAFAEAKPNRTLMTWDVGGVMREALVYLPASAKTETSPLVFVFHGHGGRMAGAALQFRTHQLWPEAIVVYPQGLNTPGMLTDPQGKQPGWQSQVGKQGDRDLKFFDSMLAGLSEDYQVDPKRVYATGHSNGGGFTYLLWSERGQNLAAVAPSAAVGTRNLRHAKPLPAMHLAGENDPLVKFEWQRASIERIKKLNGCAADGRPWAKGSTLFPSAADTPLVTVIHSGGHRLDSAAPELIVRFFKEHRRE